MAATLEERVEEALATARASEAAIMTVGAAAFDAAEQARRAAELAERASLFAATLAGRRLSRPAAEPSLSPEPTGAAVFPPEPAAGEIRVRANAPSAIGPEGDCLRAFNLRADRLAARLRALGARPVGLTV